MKIVYLITGLGGGGAEKVVVDLATRMVNLGHHVKIAYLKGSVVVEPNSEAIELVYLGLESIKHAKLAYNNYKNLLDRFEPDVVHAHMVHANIFARISRKFRPIAKLICTAHSNNEGGKARMLAYRLTHRLSEITTNVSQSASASFERLGAVPRGGITTVYNGIDLDKFKYDTNTREILIDEFKLDHDSLLLLAVGRLHPAKDYSNLLKAFAQIKQNTNQNIQLLIAGDGEERAYIQQLIGSLALQKNVNLLGRRNDIPQLMSAADLFVLSSSFEGFGLVVAEAMACNTFVVATDCGGTAEIMGDTGILVPPQNSEALAEALKKAVKKTPLEIQENNLKARQRVEELFSLEKSVQNWLKLYEQN
nr:glycosyltransferase [uncultured Acinetobacter sp.]